MTPGRANHIEDHMLNRPSVPLAPEDVMLEGWDGITALLLREADRVFAAGRHTCLIGMDGYPGTDWQTLTHQLREACEQRQVGFTGWNVEECRLADEAMDALLQPYLGTDPVFGRLYKKGLSTFCDSAQLSALKANLRQARNGQKAPLSVIVCYGTGALLGSLRSRYDVSIYCDLTREQSLKRNRQWNQLSGKTQSISPKKLYYVDMPVNDRHRSRVLAHTDYYIDGNDPDRPLLLAAPTLQKVCRGLADSPIRLKYMYEPGPWGGQWLKKIRRLPDEWVNCAWSYEVIATEMSALIHLNNLLIELPWTLFLDLQYNNIMGSVPRRRFGGEFPIRFDYLDTMDGGDLSIQVHPTTAYICEQFGETYHQGEMYYIVEAKAGAAVKLGLREETRIDQFQQAARLADEQGIPLDGSQYVNQVPAHKHDLLMIPPGTVHGSGEGLVVLEISATTYRYTFKIYDYLRPDLNGVMRPIHVEHAFHVIKPFRRSGWVARNLVQSPLPVRAGADWTEFLIGDRREFFHVVFRLEFEHAVEDDTRGKFHILTLVEGESILLHAAHDARNAIEIRYSETVIIPATFGKYRMVNQGGETCKVVKARLR
ncbi:MAG: class I mannose-6-phosphate isomerase [Anaerolineae bacterium]|nr:class I mannose-6-phosphate isomerase [Anaerolineae bacterium]